MKCKSPSHYLISNFTANWHGATEYCFSIGMRLAIIESEEENDKVIAMAKSSKNYKADDFSLWLGASDLAKEGKFRWHATGMPIRYKESFRPGQPDDDQRQEDCLVLVNNPAKGWNWHWNDVRCDIPFYFLCENIKNTRKMDVIQVGEAELYCYQ